VDTFQFLQLTELISLCNSLFKTFTYLLQAGQLPQTERASELVTKFFGKGWGHG